MSKNITIQEGGLAKQLTANKLKTNLVGGGTCLWVPEDEISLTTKHITENGTYRASDEGYYGYSEVTVNGIGIASGKDGDGDDAVVYPDPVTGELTEEKLPSSISVITPPTEPVSGIYADGQAIVKTGMVVKAYLKSGAEYGVVPNDEITLNPSVAHYDPAEVYTTVHENINGWPNPFSTCGGINIYNGQGESAWLRHKYEFTVPTAAIQRDGGGQWYAIMASETNRHAGTWTQYRVSDHSQIYQTTEYYTSTSYTKNGKTVYYYTIAGSAGELPDIPNRGEDGNAKDVAWALIYGENKEEHSGPPIEVQWPQPHTGTILTTSFVITVAKPLT